MPKNTKANDKCNSHKRTSKNASQKILIVYLSRTNNTTTIAEIIHNNAGGTLVALELEKPYPENYMATVQFAHLVVAPDAEKGEVTWLQKVTEENTMD